MKIQSIVKSAALFTLCILAASCIQIKNIEQAWKKSKGDDALVGTWNGENNAIISFAKTDRDFLVTSGTVGLEGGCKSISSNGHKFILIASFQASLLGFDKMKADDKNGTLLRYSVENDTLKMHSYDEKKIEEAVKAGKVKGEIDENGSATISELDEATIAWLAKVADEPGWDEQVYKKAK